MVLETVDGKVSESMRIPSANEQVEAMLAA